MITQYYTVYDKAASAYLPPFAVRARGEAIRNFMNAVGTPDHQFNKYPSDYDLYYVGQFDDQRGEFSSPKEGPEKIITALECHASNAEKEKGA